MAGVLCALGGNRPFTVLKLASRTVSKLSPRLLSRQLRVGCRFCCRRRASEGAQLMKLLAAEDRPKNGAYLQQGLTEAGFTVHRVVTGSDALQHALSKAYDLMITASRTIANRSLDFSSQGAPRSARQFLPVVCVDTRQMGGAGEMAAKLSPYHQRYHERCLKSVDSSSKRNFYASN